MKSLLNVLFFSLFVFVGSSCSSDDSWDASSQEGESLDVLKVSSDGVSTFMLNNFCPVLEATDPLSVDEIEFLYAIREDEKLAKDLNVVFSSKYPQARPFSNLAQAEANHIATVEQLLTYYEVDFPALGQVGVFQDKERQAIYNNHLLTGATLTGAFQAIASIEEENIVAYRQVLPNIKNPNIKLLITHLLNSSVNHFKVAINQLTLLGESYIPAKLDQKSFQELVGSAFHHGSKHSQQGNHGQHTNSGKGNHHQGNKGSVNGSGHCSGAPGGSQTGGSQGKGQPCKGYRGGR